MVKQNLCQEFMQGQLKVGKVGNAMHHIGILKDKNIISIVTGKVFNKIQQLFLQFQQMRNKFFNIEMYLNNNNKSNNKHKTS